jgi:hypothetical protein
MRKKSLVIEAILIVLWTVLFINAPFIQGKLLFGIGIKTHLLILGGLIVVSSVVRRLIFVNKD